MQRPNYYPLGLRIVPKKRRDAFPVPKFDFLAKIDTCKHVRDDFRRKAERGQRSFEVYVDALRDDLADPIAKFPESEIQLLVAYEE